MSNPNSLPDDIHSTGSRLGSLTHSSGPTFSVSLPAIWKVADSQTRLRGPRQPSSKVCSSCRTDKTKCDGQSTCRNCQRKQRTCEYGFVPRARAPAQRSIKSCVSCRYSHKTCDRAKPCGRCSQYRLICSLDDQSHSTEPLSGATAQGETSVAHPSLSDIQPSTRSIDDLSHQCDNLPSSSTAGDGAISDTEMEEPLGDIDQMLKECLEYCDV